MLSKSLLVFCAASVAAPTFALQSARAGTLTDLTTINVPGSVPDNTTPFAINNSGEIAGTYYDPAVGFRVFSLTDGSYTTVEPAGSVNGSSFVSLNNSGQIVGFSNTATPPSFGNYYLASNGVYSAFPPPNANTPAGATFSFYNDNGAIAGQAPIGTTGNTTAFIAQNGVIVTIAPPTTTSTSINAINNAGAAVGGFFPAVMPSPTANQAAFLYSGGTYTTLDAPGSTFTEATGINDLGEVVGYFDSVPVTGPGGISETPIIGFTYQNGVYTDYSVPGEVETELFGINNAGEVVGYYGDEMGNAQGFSASTVPEPASMLLMGTGVLGFALIRRGRKPG
jgi:hypothetical protein